MNEQEACDDFRRAYNRLCVVRGVPHMQLPEDTVMYPKQMESWAEPYGDTLRIEFAITHDPLPPPVDFESTAVDEPVELPGPHKQLTQGD